MQDNGSPALTAYRRVVIPGKKPHLIHNGWRTLDDHPSTKDRRTEVA